MTIITTSYDALITLIGNTLTSANGWVRLTNPDEILENFDSFLRQGWCLVAGDSVNTNRELCKISSWNRNFSLIMAVEYYGNNANYSIQDDAIKVLLEASTAMAVAIENDQTLGIGTGNVIARVSNDSGIVPVEYETRKFITCSLSVSIETFIGY
jgi:hypothetical protein